MTKLQTYTVKGEKSGTTDLPKHLVSKINKKLLSQALFVYEDRSHKGTSLVKTRSNITASGAKIYKQKGTGRARHGDVKAPIFVGGGIAHGPKGLKRTLSLSKILKKKSFIVALNHKALEGKLVLVEKLNSIVKTKEAAKLVEKISSELKFKAPSVLVALSLANKNVTRSFRNIKNLYVDLFKTLSAKDIFTSALVLVDKEALNETESKTTGTKGDLAKKTETLNKDVEVKTSKVAKSTTKKLKTERKSAKRVSKKGKK